MFCMWKQRCWSVWPVWEWASSSPHQCASKGTAHQDVAWQSLKISEKTCWFRRWIWENKPEKCHRHHSGSDCKCFWFSLKPFQTFICLLLYSPLLQTVFPKTLLPNSTFHFMYITPPTSLASPTSSASTSSTSTPSSHTSSTSPTSLAISVTSPTWTSPTSHTSSTFTSSTPISFNSIYITYIIHSNFIYRCSRFTYRLHISYKTPRKSFAQEFCHRSCSTGVLTQEFLHRSSDTEVVTQELVQRSSSIRVVGLLHRSCCTQELSSRWSTCILTPAGRRWTINKLRFQLSGATLCGDRARRTHKRVVTCKFLVPGRRPFAWGSKMVEGQKWCKIAVFALQMQTCRTKWGSNGGDWGTRRQ